MIARAALLLLLTGVLIPGRLLALTVTRSATFTPTPTATSTPTMTPTRSQTPTPTPSSCVGEGPTIRSVEVSPDGHKATIRGFARALICFRGGRVFFRNGAESVLSLEENCSDATFVATVALTPGETLELTVCQFH